MPDELAGFAIEEETEEEAAFADTVPTSSRQTRNITTKVFIESSIMRALILFVEK